MKLVLAGRYSGLLSSPIYISVDGRYRVGLAYQYADSLRSLTVSAFHRAAPIEG